MMVNSSGCDPEVARLVEENVGLVYKPVSAAIIRHKLPLADKEDLVQEALIGIMRAAKTWDPEKGAFSNHATWWIRAAISRYVTDQYRNKRRMYLDALSLDVGIDSHRTENDSEGSLAECIQSDMDVEAEVTAIHMADIQAAIQKISSRINWDILMEKANEGCTNEQLAKRHGVTEQAIQQKLKRARKRLAQEMREDGYEIHI